MTDHDSIAVRAYHLWEQRGRPEGRELDIWFEAESEMAREQSTPPSPELGERPRISNLDRELSPARRHDARAARKGPSLGGEKEEMTRDTASAVNAASETNARAPHFVAVLDRAHLRIYSLKTSLGNVRAQFELAESFDLPAGRENYTDRDTDQARRFRTRGGPMGGSIDERLPMQTEHNRRLIAELANLLTRFFEENEEATWDYAAGPAVHNAVLERLPVAVRDRLEVTLVKELVHQSPAELRAYFTA